MAPSLSPAPYLIRGAGIEKLLPSFQGQQAARSLLVCAPFSCLSLHTALLFSMAFITQKTMSSKESLPFPLRVMTDRRLNAFLLLPSSPNKKGRGGLKEQLKVGERVWTLQRMVWDQENPANTRPTGRVCTFPASTNGAHGQMEHVCSREVSGVGSTCSPQGWCGTVRGDFSSPGQTPGVWT